MLLQDVGGHLLVNDWLAPPSLDLDSGKMTLDVWVLLQHPDRPAARLGARRIETTLPAFLSAITQQASDIERIGAVSACTVVTEGLSMAEL